ncbi:PTS transporter subunit EIIC [Pediococcus damnosus]|uniref:PTS transporter subunit EIIC n=1 Tax=Pediococcus damnosus TaxID=51663 RepID=UPI000A893591|nr:PTS transporter subunit EIIC [Pediococcus damnosus]
MMENQLINFTQRLTKKHFYQAIINALRILLPFEFIGISLHIIYETTFHRNGIFEAIFDLHSHIPAFKQIGMTLKVSESLIFLSIALLIAFLVADLLVSSSTKYQNNHLAGLISLILYFTLISETSPSLNLLQISESSGNILLPIVMGLIIGFSFLKLQSNFHSTFDTNLSILLFFIFILIVGAIGLTVHQTQYYATLFYQQVTSLLNIGQHPSFFKILLAVSLRNIAHFFGMISDFTNTVANHFPDESANLAYASAHHNLWKIPYPITFHTLYNSYGMLGGSGMLLALNGTLLFKVKDKQMQFAARLSMGQTLFDQGGTLLFGIPVLFNPLLLIPFLLSPLVSMILAFLFISWKLVPPATYMIPNATPSLLRAFLGTNGDWRALILSLICVAVSGIIYYPFVKMLNRVTLEQGDEMHD